MTSPCPKTTFFAKKISHYHVSKKHKTGTCQGGEDATNQVQDLMQAFGSECHLACIEPLKLHWKMEMFLENTLGPAPRISEEKKSYWRYYWRASMGMFIAYEKNSRMVMFVQCLWPAISKWRFESGLFSIWGSFIYLFYLLLNILYIFGIIFL